MINGQFCRRFGHHAWPFLIVAFLGAFVAFITWLTLAAAGFPAHVIFGWSIAAFLLVSLVLGLNAVSCVRRHRRPPPPGVRKPLDPGRHQ